MGPLGQVQVHILALPEVVCVAAVVAVVDASVVGDASAGPLGLAASVDCTPVKEGRAVAEVVDVAAAAVGAVTVAVDLTQKPTLEAHQWRRVG